MTQRAANRLGYLNRSVLRTASVSLVGLNPAGDELFNDQPSWRAFNRNDRRDVLGLRWEHSFDNNTVWRTQAIYDDKNIIQPTGNTAALQDEPAVNASTDITQFGSLAGFEARHFAGLYFNRTRYTSYTNNTLPFGDRRDRRDPGEAERHDAESRRARPRRRSRFRET